MRCLRRQTSDLAFGREELFEAARALQLSDGQLRKVFLQARCTESCARNHSLVRARREPLDDEVNLVDRLFDFSAPRR